MTDQVNNLHFRRRQVLSILLAGGATTAFAPALLGRDKAMAQDGAPTGQMILGFSQEPTQFNPHLPHIEVDDGVYFALYDTLFTIDPKGQFVASLCTEVPTVENGGISEDGLHWRIKLRDDVKWHDGKQFTAEDVKFTLEMLADPSFNAWRRTGYDLVRDIEVVSPTELTWRMERLFAPLPSILAGTFIVPKHGFDGAEDKNTALFNNAPIGTGPFKLERRVPSDRIEFTANKDYFGEGPYLEHFIMKYISDVNVMYTQFESGDIDVVGLAWIQPDRYAEAKELPGKVAAVMPSSAVECIAFNLEHPALKELPVRQAIYHALDKKSIIDDLYYGLPTATDSYVPQQSYYYNPDLPAHEFNLEKAGKLLDDAGWVKGSDGIREKNGVRLSFENSTTSGNSLREQLQQVFQQDLASIGIEMKIANMPAAVVFGDHWFLSQFQTQLFGENYLAGGDPDVGNYFRSTGINAKGGSGLNFWQWVNPEVDELLIKGSSSFVPDERREAYFRIQEIVREELPFMPIYQRVKVSGWKEGVSGVEANVNVRIDDWNVNLWRWG